jgi:hypothetical protein
MDFNIESVWAEMARIKSKKAETQEFFDDFRRDFYGKDPDAFHGECSPTKRLMKMKDATAKNQIAGYEDEKGEGYKMRYTTSPKKGYIVKPKKGEIKYDKYKEKHADKFMDRIAKQELEIVELEAGRMAAGSPIKVSKKTITRGEEVRL